MGPLDRSQITAVFDEHQLRLTPQRYAVMDFLVRYPIHATADQIFDAINQADPRASRATVYNSLKTLVDAGMVREIALEGRAARFDANIERHHHFVCDACGRLEDIDWFDVPNLAETLAPRTVREYELLLRGLCSACRTTHETL